VEARLKSVSTTFVPVLFAAALVATAPASRARADDVRADAGDPLQVAQPYVYQTNGAGAEMSVTLQYEAGYGTRESRNFVQDGIEQGLRVRFQPWSFLGVEAFGGLVLTSWGGYQGWAAGVEVIGRALEQSKHWLNLDVGAGYIRDYREAHIPRVRLTLGHTFDKLDVSLSGLMEIPVGSAGRDEVDVMTSVAVSYGVAEWARLGLEVAAEDLEGFLEPEEAEGGAKLLFGPTLALTLPMGFFVKLNAAPVYAFLGNQEPAPGASRPPEWGFMGRAVVGWTWH
jgi:hypothetical protein